MDICRRGQRLTIIGYCELDSESILTKQAQQPCCTEHALHCDDYKMEASLSRFDLASKEK